MLITLATTILCDGHDRSVDKSAGPTNFSLSAPISVQMAEYLRATYAVPIARGNMRAELAFGVHRLCESVNAAELWILSHVSTVPRSGTLTIAPDGGGGSITLANAVLDNPQLSHTGCSVFVQYHLIAGTITV